MCERYIGCLSHAPAGDLAHNPGMCPKPRSKPVTFTLQTGAQSTELHWPRLYALSFWSSSLSYKKDGDSPSFTDEEIEAQSHRINLFKLYSK